MRRFQILFCSVLLITSGGCASYTAKPVPVPEFGAMPVRYMERDMRIGVDPYIEIERQAAVFDVDLGKCRVLPIQLLVQNQGQRAVWVRSTDVRLNFADGTQLSPIDVFTVGRCGSPGTVGEQPSPVTPPTQPMWGLGPQAGALAGLVGAAVGATSLAIAEGSARDPRTADLQRKELRGSLLRQNNSTNGFIFFISHWTSSYLRMPSWSSNCTTL